MSHSSHHKLEDLLGLYVNNALLTQDVYDQHYEEEILRLDLASNDKQTFLKESATAIIPSRIFLKTFQCQLNIELVTNSGKAMSTGIEILGTPVTRASFLFSEKKRMQSSISIEIEQLLIHQNLKKNHGRRKKL